MCNYSCKGEDAIIGKIKLLDRNGPFIINYEQLFEEIEPLADIMVKQSEIICL